MPGPPPPPPAAPPPPLFSTAPRGGGAGDERSALLKSIRQGAKLKKTVTVDKSAPMIAGKVSTPVNNGTIGKSAGSSIAASATSSSSPMTNGLALGGLFAGGMPKLRATGIQLDSAGEPPQPNRSNKPRTPDVPAIKPKIAEAPVQPNNTNFSNIQNQLKKQLALDSRSRGPPPPAPVRTPSDDTQYTKQSFSMTHQQSSSTVNLSTLQANASTLHRKASSNVNISSLDSSLSLITNTVNNSGTTKPVISHGKPNLAPKPPLNGKPAMPPKKLIIGGKPVGRAQSMKSPRSPSPQSPDATTTAVAKFGTVRNLASVMNSSASLAASTGNLSRPRPALSAARPSAPPPSVPPPPAPTTAGSGGGVKTVRAPGHAPPPPPPNHAPPPPPPQRGQAPQVPSRAPPAIPQHNSISNNNNGAPPPPPRHSSIRGDSNNTTKRMSAPTDLEVKYADRFHPVSHFPRPPPFRRVFKAYSSKQVGSKQQAPRPPVLLVHQQSRSWDASAC